MAVALERLEREVPAIDRRDEAGALRIGLDQVAGPPIELQDVGDRVERAAAVEIDVDPDQAPLTDLMQVLGREVDVLVVTIGVEPARPDAAVQEAPVSRSAAARATAASRYWSRSMDRSRAPSGSSRVSSLALRSSIDGNLQGSGGHVRPPVAGACPCRISGRLSALGVRITDV
jgi:hypothetical protein